MPRAPRYGVRGRLEVIWMMSMAILAALVLVVAAELIVGIRGALGVSARAGGGLCVPWSGVMWALVFLTIAVLMAGLFARGMVADDPVSLLVLAVVLTVGAAAQVRAVALARRFGVARHPYGRALAIVGVAAACAMLALELPSNHVLWAMAPGPALLEFALILCLVAAMYFLPRRHGALAAVGVAALATVGIAEYFVVSFKSMPIQPGDLFALGTAATVAGSYAYELSPYCIYGIACAALGILALSLSGPLGAVGSQAAPACEEGRQPALPREEAPQAAPACDSPRDAGGHAPAAAPALLAAAAPKPRRLPLSIDRRTALIAMAALAAQPFIDYYDDLAIRLHTWSPLESYYRQGFLPTFISSAQKMVPVKPAHYQRAAAEELIRRHAAAWGRGAMLGASSSRMQAEEQFDQLKPSVVCIMNESFADLSIFDGLHSGYAGPARFSAIPDALLRGVSYMSAFGAGTCNSEFEFLTGSSMAFLGAGVYPYMTYNLAPVENLARQFKQLGYRALAMHPNHGTNWNRENVFADLGFDEFRTIEDFAGAPELCRKVTDAATYDACLEALRTSEAPVFIHDVTMQNHAGYNTGLIPADRRLDLACPDVDAEVKAWTDEYCALMDASDEAFAAFLDSLRELERPVVVVMYGDHQPFFTDRYNDAIFAGEDAAEHTKRIWQTSYVVWANYDVAGVAPGGRHVDASIGYVGAMALQAIGAPLSDYQKARLAVREKLPAINVVGFADERGGWHLPDEAAAAFGARAARDNLEQMQYRVLFDHGGPTFATRKQAAANQTDATRAPGGGA